MNRVVVAIEDGVVAGVYSTDQELEVVIVDLDSTEGEEVIIEIPAVEKHVQFLHDYREGIRNVPALSDLVAWLGWKE